MNHENLNKIVLIFILYLIQNIGFAFAQEEYRDDFNIKPLDSSSWTALIPNTWQIVNGMVSSTGGRPGLIFETWDGKKYISEIDVTGNDTINKEYSAVGFYFYYEDSNNYGRVVFRDNNNPNGDGDGIVLEQMGSSFTNTKTYTNTSTNTSIEFDPNTFHHLKVVRLNKNIYVYFDNRLALTTEFKDEKTKGKVGFDIVGSTGYFDNFYLRPITMNNASGYINELNLDSTTPTTRIGSIYTLSLDSVDNKEALFSLDKFGKTVDSAVGSKGDTVSLNFENGDEAVNFKVTSLFDAGNNSAVWLEDIISATTDDLNLAVDEITLNPSYYQEEDMDIRFSITNLGGIRFTGTPGITITTQGSNQTLNPELDLASNESRSFNATLTAPQKPGRQTVTISV